MENLSKNNSIKKVKFKKTFPKVKHTVRVLTQKDIDEERSNAYRFIL